MIIIQLYIYNMTDIDMDCNNYWQYFDKKIVFIKIMSYLE